ncbi:MAG: acyl-CoA thioesterase [Gammaproteobacteria bacterium]
MFRTRIHPRFCDTDALGHVGNTVIPVWLLEGRESILRLFAPDLDFRKASLVVVRTEIDFLAEVRYGTDIEVTSAVEKIGNSSLVVRQEVHQQETACCRARTVMVNFDPATRRSRAIPESVRRQLEEHLAAA